MGIGFWRAHEILVALKDHKLNEDMFTYKLDVYRYAITCYEIFTGHILFKGHPLNDYGVAFESIIQF